VLLVARVLLPQGPAGAEDNEAPCVGRGVARGVARVWRRRRRSSDLQEEEEPAGAAGIEARVLIRQGEVGATSLHAGLELVLVCVLLGVLLGCCHG